MPTNRTLPWSWYTDPAILDRERQRIFRRSWQYVGHIGMLGEPYGFFPADLAGIPVVVSRDETGTLHALLNVCAHRGAVVCEAAGVRATLQCPYHAWSYGLDGSLLSAPRSNRETDFDLTAHRLTRLPVDTWGPFIFVNPDVDAAPLTSALGDIPERVGEVLDVDDLVPHHRIAGDYRANWKICVENYLECYHCRVAHPTFARLVDTGPDDYRLIAAATGSSQYGPVQEGWSGAYDPSGAIGRGQFHLINPNTTINIFPGRPNLSIGPVQPKGPGTTHRFLDYFFGPDVEEAWIEEMRALDDEVGGQDVALVESVQRGMDAEVRADGVLLLDSERLIAEFGTYLRRALDLPP